jgi:phosphotransferase system IIB component
VKNYSFPLPASRVAALFRNLTITRFALLLALVAAISALPFYVFAQADSAPSKARNFVAYNDGGAYIVYQGPNGETVCRDASVNETRSLRSVQGTSGLRQINHLSEKMPLSPELNTTQSATGLTIILRATAQLDAQPDAKAAFVAAAAKWETLIKDPITIIIDVDYGTTFFGTPFSSANVLGATSTQLLFFPNNYTDVRGRLNSHANGASEQALAAALPTTTVPSDIGAIPTILGASPLLRALGALPADAQTDVTTPGQPPRIAFNSAFNFDLDPNDGITGNRTDFDAVAVHEIGHALGFNSEVGSRELDPSEPLLMSIWDLFRFRPSTANLGNFSTAQRVLQSGGVQILFNGGAELGLSTGRPDGSGGDGRQASHWKDDLNFQANNVGIMDPTIARNVRQIMSVNDEEAIDRMGYTISATTPPPNDAFANAQGISGTNGSVAGTNIFASKEAGEPSHSPDGNLGGKSVWYLWTAPSSGTASLTTDGSNYDTLLAVYTGNVVNGLNAIVKNDDVQSGVITTSTVQFQAVGGTTYHIAVDGFDGDQGNITLNFTLPGAATPTPTPTPFPNTVQFTASTANVSETFHANTQVDLTVTRTGSTAAAASVDYATSNATASDRSDYIAALGTLQFAGGETQKTVSVLIIDDGYVEGSETFNLTLSNPVSCTLGTPAAVSVTISSGNDVGGGTNPVKDPTFDNEFFVRQQYFDFLSRAPDAGGLGFWKAEIDQCGSDAACIEIKRINVSAAFFLSIEFQETGYLVERMYKSAYGDANALSALDTFPAQHAIKAPIVRLNEFLADSQLVAKDLIVGVPGWPTVLENNKVAYTQAFVVRSRFLTAHPTSKTPTQFVNDLNTNTGNTLTGNEVTSIIGEFGGAGNIANVPARARALRRVAENANLVQLEKNKAFVLMQYFGYMRRNPNDPQDVDHTGYDFWLHKLDTFNGNFVGAEMVKAFIVSIEYQGRFGN